MPARCFKKASFVVGRSGAASHWGWRRATGRSLEIERLIIANGNILLCRCPSWVTDARALHLPWRGGPVCRVPVYEIGEMAWKSSTVGRMLRSVKNWWIMKIALITIGLFATAVSQASPAFARGTLHLLAPWNSEHVKPDEGTQPACKGHGRHRSGSAQKQHISPACPPRADIVAAHTL